MACETTSSDDLLAIAWSNAFRSGVDSGEDDAANGLATTFADAIEGLFNTRDDAAATDDRVLPKRLRRE